MELEFFYDSTVEPFRVDDYDKDKVLELLERLRRAGVRVKIHDTAGWSGEMQMEHYLRAVFLSVRGKYGIRRGFGSARNPGWLFGRQVPALIVREANRDVDVYPHRLGEKRVTILGFLRGLLSDIQEKRRRAG